jgi:hypothetical protein
MMEAVQERYPELDLYTLDARGTGYSGYLSCPVQETNASDGGSWVTLDELDACIAHVEQLHGDHLDVFGPTQSSHDVRGRRRPAGLRGHRLRAVDLRDGRLLGERGTAPERAAAALWPALGPPASRAAAVCL